MPVTSDDSHLNGPLTELEGTPSVDPLAVDLVGIYLKEIGRFPLLDWEDELRLSRAARRGDRQAKERLTLCNLRLVVYVARQYAGRGGLSLLDLIQEGNLGLLRAVEKYDPDRGYRFSTYAMWWIHHAIRRALVAAGRTIRLPHSVIQLGQKIDALEQRWLDERGFLPSDEALAGALGISTERLSQVRTALQSGLSFEGVADPEEDGRDLQETLSDLEATSPEQTALWELWSEALLEELERLSPRQHEVFRWRYGLVDGQGHTLAAVGERLGISRERARQLEQQALSKLRRSRRLQQIGQLLKRP